MWPQIIKNILKTIFSTLHCIGALVLYVSFSPKVIVHELVFVFLFKKG